MDDKLSLIGAWSSRDPF